MGWQFYNPEIISCSEARPASSVKNASAVNHPSDGRGWNCRGFSAASVLLVRKDIIAMGSSDSKLNFRKAVIQLTTKTQVNQLSNRRQNCQVQVRQNRWAQCGASPRSHNASDVTAKQQNVSPGVHTVKLYLFMSIYLFYRTEILLMSMPKMLQAQNSKNVAVSVKTIGLNDDIWCRMHFYEALRLQLQV